MSLFSFLRSSRVPVPTTAPRSRSRSRLVVAGGALTALGATLAAFTTSWEGEKTEAHLDRIANPPVWTVCSGETKGVRPGDKHTRAECRAMLIQRYAEDFEPAMRACLTNPDAIPDGAYLAFADVAYNIGSKAFCGSSMARRANAGDLAGACDALLMWDKAGGKRVKGLTHRRRAERQVCLESLR